MWLQRWVWLSNNNYSFNNIFLRPRPSLSLGKTLGTFLTICWWWWQCIAMLRVISVWPSVLRSFQLSLSQVISFLCQWHHPQVFCAWMNEKQQRKTQCGLSLFIRDVMIVNRTCCEILWIESSLLTVRRAGIMQEKEWHVALNRNHYMKF